MREVIQVSGGENNGLDPGFFLYETFLDGNVYDSLPLPLGSGFRQLLGKKLSSIRAWAKTLLLA
jgi:hypothetical protein